MSVAAEVAAAIADVGQPATLRRDGAVTGPAYDPTYGDPTYSTLTVLDSQQRLRDINGTLIDQTLRTLTVATGSTLIPTKDDKVAVGIAKEAVTGATVFSEILEVRPLSPSGTTLLYEMDLAS